MRIKYKWQQTKKTLHQYKIYDLTEELTDGYKYNLCIDATDFGFIQEI